MSAQPAPVTTPLNIGPYRAHEVIGRGGSSVVYRATNDHVQDLPPVVAVKVAHDERGSDADVRRQFQQTFAGVSGDRPSERAAGDRLR